MSSDQKRFRTILLSCATDSSVGSREKLAISTSAGGYPPAAAFLHKTSASCLVSANRVWTVNPNQHENIFTKPWERERSIKLLLCPFRTMLLDDLCQRAASTI